MGSLQFFSLKKNKTENPPKDALQKAESFKKNCKLLKMT